LTCRKGLPISDVIVLTATDLKVYGRSDIGLHREENEDSFLTSETLSLYAVADGIGGLPYGDVASRLALDCLQLWGEDNGGFETEEDLRTAIEYANQCVCDEGRKLSPETGIGTTVTSFVIKQGQVLVGHVGDSSCFLFRRSMGGKITNDHTLAQEIFDKLDPGEPQPEVPDYFHHSLTRCLGQTVDFKVDIYSYELLEGDRLLACTDGVTDLLNYEDLRKLAQQAENPKQYIHKLIQAALSRGGHDNATAVSVFI
jgi:serine/threonine protein phosphatase PrpC